MAEPRTPAIAKTGPIAALFLLSLLWAAAILRMDLLPNLASASLPPFEQQAIPFAAVALAALAVSVFRRAPWPKPSQIGLWIIIGLGLFVLPAALLFLAKGIDGYTRTTLLTLTPIFALVFEPYIGDTRQPRTTQIPGGLLAALAAVVGVLCVFPVALPDSFEAIWAFAAALAAAASVAAANCWAVHQAMGEQSMAPPAAIAAAVAALVFSASSLATEHIVWNISVLLPALLWSAALDLPALLLLFWLMRRLSAVKMTARYLLAPLLAILAGAILLRTALELRTCIGLSLMAAGTAWLLFAPDAVEDPTTLSLH